MLTSPRGTLLPVILPALMRECVYWHLLALLLGIHMEDSMLPHEMGQRGTGKFPGYVTYRAIPCNFTQVGPC